MSDLSPVPDFTELAALIEERRARAIRAVNHELVSLYWEVGKIISAKVLSEGWGKKTIEELASYLKKTQPNLRGFTRPNLYRMQQFFEVYPDLEIVSALPRQLSWTHHILIISQCKTPVEREFYLKATEKEQWSSRELERQLKGALFERIALAPAKLAPAVREIHSEAANSFKDSYLVEFLNLPTTHSESDLHQGLLRHLRSFLLSVA